MSFSSYCFISMIAILCN